MWVSADCDVCLHIRFLKAGFRFMADERLTQMEMAHRLGLTPRQIANLREKGIPAVTDGGRVYYRWPDALRWYINFRVAAKEPRSDAFEHARARRETAEAGRAELRLRRERGELVELATARDRLGAVVDVLNRKLKAYPAKWSPLLVGCKTQAEVRKRLKPAVRELLTELATLE